MRRNPRADIWAGLTVAVVALPLALAFGISAGLGAQAGLITAVVAGLVAAVFGGSALQVSGPTGAMTVVLIPIVVKHGVQGVLAVGVMAGVFLIVASFLDAAQWMRFIPLSVIEGFTVGIAVVIGLQQAPMLFAVPAHGEKVVALAWHAFTMWLAEPNWLPVILAVTTAAIIRIGVRINPVHPLSLPIVVIASVVVALLPLDVPTVGALPHALPTPQAPDISWNVLPSLILPAVAVAALAGLESLLCAGVADSMSRHGDKHNGKRELFGQGIANVVSPLFGGMPATAAIARTAVNVQAGARSRLASIVHALALFAAMLIAGPLVAHIPLAALAGVLLATVIGMVNVAGLRVILSEHPRETIVLVVTAIITIVFDLVTGVLVGVVLAWLLKRIASA